MYGIFTYAYHILPLKATIHDIHVGKYTIPWIRHGIKNGSHFIERLTLTSHPTSQPPDPQPLCSAVLQSEPSTELQGQNRQVCAV